jgi:hypothetical protein
MWRMWRRTTVVFGRCSHGGDLVDQLFVKEVQEIHIEFLDADAGRSNVVAV